MLDTSYGFNNLLKEVQQNVSSGTQTFLRLRRSCLEEHPSLQGNQRQDQEIIWPQW